METPPEISDISPKELLKTHCELYFWQSTVFAYFWQTVLSYQAYTLLHDTDIHSGHTQSVHVLTSERIRKVPVTSIGVYMIHAYILYTLVIKILTLYQPMMHIRIMVSP